MENCGMQRQYIIHYTWICIYHWVYQSEYARKLCNKLLNDQKPLHNEIIRFPI